ncbi:MAG: hypothetical protein IPM47_21075 [Sphingobacteriales bacterium]|nr:MAG: hypothetical protein IPM47_21075 [Sphingobacteriales bacterium]
MVYGVETLPGDTTLRQAIDTEEPRALQGLFGVFIQFLRDCGVLQQRRVLAKLSGFTAVAIDGTNHYCSGNKCCAQCLVKEHRDGETGYYHQTHGAVCVHPDQATVFVLGAEAIVKQDGNSKNDCELNAIKRLLPQIRERIGAEKIIVLLDGLYCNGAKWATSGQDDQLF